MEEASPAEFEKAMQLITDFQNKSNSKSTWPGIDKLNFVTQLWSQTFYKGYTINQGHGWQCGVAAPAHLFASRNPIKYVEAMISLYEEGYFLKANGVSKVVASGYLTDITFDSHTGLDNNGLGMKAIDFMLLTTVRNDLNDFYDFEGTPAEDVAGGTWPSEIRDITTKYFGLTLTKNKYYTNEKSSDLNEVGSAIRKGKGVIFFINNQGANTDKKDAKESDKKSASYGIHYVVIKSMYRTYNKDGSIKTVRYKYWDYGASQNQYKDSGIMSYEQFKESTKGIFITEK